MATLAYCLEKLGFTKAEQKRLKKDAKEREKKGFSPAEAATSAVENMLNLLERERSSILEQAKKAGYIPPEKPGVLEYPVEGIKVTPEIKEREIRGKEADETKRLQAIGLEQVPGLRLTDQEEAGKLYEMLQRGELEQADWDKYVADLRMSGKAPKEPEVLPRDHPQVQALGKLVEKYEKILAGQREAGISGMDLNEAVLDVGNMRRAYNLFREGKQDRDVFQDLTKNYPEILEAIAEQAKVEKPTIYNSGQSRITDLRSGVHAGVPVGVSVAELTGPATDLLEKYAAEGGQIFMDSGVYQGKEPDWPKTFDTYDRIQKAAISEVGGRQVSVVAPDVFGDQAASLEILKTHKDRVLDLIELGADVIVPLQMRQPEGETFRLPDLRPPELYKEVISILGTDQFRVGIPSAKKRPQAWVDNEVAELMAMKDGPKSIHFLGLGDTQASRIKLATKKIGAENITMDAMLSRPQMGVISEKRAAIEAELTEEEKLPGFAREEAIHAVMHPQLLGKGDLGQMTLIACCQEKLPKRAMAKDLYQGDLFKKSREFVEQRNADWRILSAEHGLVNPVAGVDPYDKSMADLSKAEKEKWAQKVVDDLMETVRMPTEGEFSRITLLAGKDYREFVVPLLEQLGFDVFVPMEGMGIGQQLGWLKRGIEGYGGEGLPPFDIDKAKAKLDEAGWKIEKVYGAWLITTDKGITLSQYDKETLKGLALSPDQIIDDLVFMAQTKEGTIAAAYRALTGEKVTYGEPLYYNIVDLGYGQRDPVGAILRTIKGFRRDPENTARLHASMWWALNAERLKTYPTEIQAAFIAKFNKITEGSKVSMTDIKAGGPKENQWGDPWEPYAAKIREAHKAEIEPAKAPPEPVVEELEIPAYTKKRKTFAPGTKERAKLLDDPLNRLEKEIDAKKAEIDKLQKQHDKTRRNAYKKRAALQKQINELWEEHTALGREAAPLRKQHFRALLEDAQENPRDDAQKLAVESRILEIDKELTDDLSAAYRRGIQQLAHDETKRQEIIEKDQQQVAMEYTNDLLAQPLSSTYELAPWIKTKAASLAALRWKTETRDILEKIEGLHNMEKYRFTQELENLSIWDAEKAKQIVARAKVTAQDNLKKEAATRKEQELEQEQRSRVNATVEVAGKTIQEQKKSLDEALAKRIFELTQKEPIEEAPGRVIIKVGDTVYNLEDSIESLAWVQKRTGVLVSKIDVGVPSRTKLPTMPKTLLRNLTSTKPSHRPVKGKPPAGDPVLWTSGHIIDLGTPPKGSKKEAESPVEYPMVKDIWDRTQELIQSDNQVVGEMVFKIDEETGKPTDQARVKNKKDQIIGVDPRYIAYFVSKYPNVKFYFDLPKNVNASMISVTSKEEQVGVIASKIWAENEKRVMYPERVTFETGKVPLPQGGVLHPKGVLEREKFFPNYKGRKVTEIAIDGAALLMDPIEYDIWIQMIEFNIGRANAKLIDKEARRLYKRWTERTEAILDQVQELFKAGMGTIGWYERSQKAIESKYGKDADIFTQFFAITSAGMKTITNRTLAEKAYKQWKMGDREFRNFRHAMKVNLQKAARGEPWYDQLYRETRPGQIEPEFRKTGNFYKALRGDTSAVVVDLWVRRAFGYDMAKRLNAADYDFMESVIRQVARDNDLTPRDIQEAIWMGAKLTVEGPDADIRDVGDLLEARELYQGGAPFDEDADPLRQGDLFEEVSEKIEASIRKSYGGSSGKGYASVGEYATAGEHAAPLAQIMDLVEIVRMATDLLGGKFPEVKTRLRKRNALGTFYYGGLVGRIALRADIFADPKLAAAVLAHEVGHVVDWLPEHTFKRGNILGHIASLKNHLKHTLPRFPGAPEELTEADRRRLRYQAEQMIKAENADKWIDETIREEMPISPEDVLAIWNDIERAKLLSEDFRKFIAMLNTPEKKAIIKEAMRGVTHEMLSQFATVVEKPTGRRIQVEIYEEYTDKHGRKKKRLKEEFRKKVSERYAELVNKEIEKLRLFKLDEVLNELKSLTRAWKPFDPAADPEYTRYRYENPELYADAISVLINAPGLLKSMAPSFWEGFFNYLGNKPEVMAVYNEIQDTIRAGLADDVIIKELYQDVRRGDEIKKKRWDTLKGRDPRSEEFLRDFFDANYTTQKHIRAAPENLIPPGENPRYTQEALIYTNSEVELLLHDVKSKMIAPLEEAGLNWDDFGVHRLLKRVAGGHPVWTKEGAKAFPRGLTPPRAKKLLTEMRRNREPEQNLALRNANMAFEDLGRFIIDKGEEANYWSPELIEEMKDNVKYYATIDVIKYMEQRFGLPVTAKIFPRIGTLYPTGNVATATIEKYIAIIKAINRQHHLVRLTKFLEDFKIGKYGQLPEEFRERPIIRSAERRWNGRFRELIDPPRGSNEGLIAWLENGKAVGRWVHKWIADEFERNPYETLLLSRMAMALSRPLKKIFVEVNPGFILITNPWRDYWDMVKKLPDARAFLKVNWKNLIKGGTKLEPGMWYWYLQAIKPAYKSIFRVPDEVGRELLQEKALISIASYYGIGADEREIERMLAQFRLMPHKWDNKILKPFADFFNFITNFGRVVERIPKFATYKYLTEKFPDMDREVLMHKVRSAGGSPMFMRRGRANAIYNNLLLFSNPTKEGYRAHWEAYKEDPLIYLWKQLKYTVLPKFLMMAGMMGLLGLGVREIYRRVSDYMMANYYVIPIGITPNGKSVSLTIPQDETSRFIGGFLWRLYKYDEPQYWASLFDYMAGQAPTLNPMLKTMIDVVQYASGNNPYNAYRGEYAIPNQTLFEAHDARTHAAFMKYIATQLGAGILYKFEHDDLEKVKTELERVIEYPILSNVIGRFVRVSAEGERRDDRVAKELIRRTRSRDILDAKEILVKMVNNEPISYEDGLKLALYGDNAIEQQQVVLLARRFGDVVIEQYLSSRSIEERAAVLMNWLQKYSLEPGRKEITYIWGVPEIIPEYRKKEGEKKPTKKEEPKGALNLDEWSRQIYKEREKTYRAIPPKKPEPQRQPALGGE